MKLIYEDFSDFNIGELPYDKGHSALGEYHHIEYDGYFGNFYDPICLHQWRSLDGSWLITSRDSKHYLEQNRGDNSKGHFESVYSVLVHKTKIYSCSYTIEYDFRMFEVTNYGGIAFSYLTSRNYYAVGIKKDTLTLYKRYDEDFDIISSINFDFDDTKTYHIKVEVSNNVRVYIDDELLLEGVIDYKIGRNIAFVSKSQVRYSNLLVTLTDNEYNEHLSNLDKELKRLDEKRSKYSELELVKKIHLGKCGSGRQLRIAKQDGKTYLLFAQHQKRHIRDSFASISSMSLFEYESGSLIWSIGEPNNSIDNTLISCDLPMQIADINNDGRLELVYAIDFMVIAIDLLTKEEVFRMNTPIVYNDPLVKNEPFYRLNVDAIRVADFEGLGYKCDFIIKDRYQNVWAFSFKTKCELFRYNHKNTGHFPYIDDINNDGFDEILIGYDLLDNKGNMIWSLPYNSDHTDEIIFAKLNKNSEPKFILASGNEGMNIVNMDGTIYKHNEIGHAQRICVGKFDLSSGGLGIIASAFWGSDGIIRSYDSESNVLSEIEVGSNGSVLSPIMYDGVNTLCLLHPDNKTGGLVDSNLDRVVLFPDNSHPTLCSEGYDLDSDGITEIMCWDLNDLYVYKAKNYVKPNKIYKHYPDTGFSNYRGEYLISDSDI